MAATGRGRSTTASASGRSVLMHRGVQILFDLSRPHFLCCGPTLSFALRISGVLQQKIYTTSTFHVSRFRGDASVFKQAKLRRNRPQDVQQALATSARSRAGVQGQMVAFLHPLSPGKAKELSDWRATHQTAAAHDPHRMRQIGTAGPLQQPFIAQHTRLNSSHRYLFISLFLSFGLLRLKSSFLSYRSASGLVSWVRSVSTVIKFFRKTRHSSRTHTPRREERDQAAAVQELEPLPHALVAADDEGRVVGPQELVRDVLPELHPGPSGRHLASLDGSRV